MPMAYRYICSERGSRPRSQRDVRLKGSPPYIISKTIHERSIEYGTVTDRLGFRLTAAPFVTRIGLNKKQFTKSRGLTRHGRCGMCQICRLANPALHNSGVYLLTVTEITLLSVVVVSARCFHLLGARQIQSRCILCIYC